MEMKDDSVRNPTVLIIGAGRVCRPAAEFLASTRGHQRVGQVIVASLYLKDAEETVEGIPKATAVQLDIVDHESLSKHVSEVEVVISLLPASFHSIVAKACIEQNKHLVTASYVDDAMSRLDEPAKAAGITVLCELGLDPGIDHMLAMKMIDQAHEKKGIVRSFTSYCGGLPSPSAANNPLAYKFSWSPAGAIRAGRNAATYLDHGEIVHVNGDSLYGSAVKFRIPDLPAFAFECLPNRNSLVYGDLYGIAKEASTIFRATLRYEGFCEIMGSLAKLGFFNSEIHPMLKEEEEKPTFGTFLEKLLLTANGNLDSSQTLESPLKSEDEMVHRMMLLGHCKDKPTAIRVIKTIKFLGLHEQEEIPRTCQSALEVICLRMEDRLAYSNTEQDMVVMYHELEVEFPDGRPSESHQMTLLEYGSTENGKTTTAMALTVGIPAAIGALLLLEDKIKTRGVIRPLDPEVYVPALDILEAYGIKVSEKVEHS